MIDETSKHEPASGHGSYERQDLQPSGVLYFLLALVVVTVLCIFALLGLYAYLDRRERASQPELNPLVANVPKDSVHVSPGYPQSVFPSPKLEEDERGQLNDIRMNEEKELNGYGWVDEKAGIVHIPIERAMNLIAERGLPVRPQGGSAASSAASAASGQQSDTSQTATKAKNAKAIKK
ncbi:MAG TPA: hypothetical protein VN911_16815 [Candidatus Acidoferrum sp.]|nr:hypothetical protein [Candidatus Acidoferrum sp.]